MVVRLRQSRAGNGAAFVAEVDRSMVDEVGTLIRDRDDTPRLGDGTEVAPGEKQRRRALSQDHRARIGHVAVFPGGGADTLHDLGFKGLRGPG